MKTILVVDDEYKIREVISSYLQNEGFLIKEAENGKDALEIIDKKSVDFIILDLMLPDMSGEEICLQIRRKFATPILMLTAKVRENDRIYGLTIGADDYMVKPFSPRELVMRVKTILRRSNPDQLLAETISFNQDELVIDQSYKEVRLKGKKIDLTPSEYKLLLVMARYPQRTYTRDELVFYVLGDDFVGDSRIIDQHIKNLRYKIKDNPKVPHYLETVYGMGYKFSGERL
ncbi:DNA-binding response OmpR family regulator [Peribacillus deserti]|uniref:DNA-binding response OmpR family regulator n=1 Tax=Peribacillus deserti TaxID=673318 RepID=A0ABS2QH32_9BACI|nr:response regulator transcription factor [Peribacillus deserti]MBM7692454.1 DNA-binding response OmpR family regulator [Peribacillus deserti]